MNQNDLFESPASQAETLYEVLIKSQVVLKDSDDHFFDHYHLGKTRFFALAHLKKQPGLSPSELSQRLLCTKGNATRIMRSLETEGYLQRQIDADDRRAQRIYLTAAGEELLDLTRQAFRQFHEIRFAGLDETERIMLQGLLEKLNLSLLQM